MGYIIVTHRAIMSVKKRFVIRLSEGILSELKKNVGTI